MLIQEACGRVFSTKKDKESASHQLSTSIMVHRPESACRYCYIIIIREHDTM